jgi:hypothetical protein
MFGAQNSKADRPTPDVPAKPAHKHDEADQDGDKQKPVGCFPNENVAEVHCMEQSVSDV